MPVLLHARNSNGGAPEPAPCLHIGLINNMPDRALAATERQFVSLLDSASDGIVVRLSLFELPGIPRAGSARDYVSRSYLPLDTLWNSRPDAVIVTGTEPRAPDLRDEPYWASFAELLAWSEHNTLSAIWSCLAAHAAVLCSDGIGRRRLLNKRFGVFECARESEHPLFSGVTPRLLMPHSRWNDVPLQQLQQAGYQVLTRDTEGMADCFLRQRKSLFVFFQGHPEYEQNTLFLEYRRDVGRYLKRESETYPSLPCRYFDHDTANSLHAAREQFTRDRRPDRLTGLPECPGIVTTAWRPGAVRIYRNWLLRLCALKEQVLNLHPSIRVATERPSTSPRSFAVGD